MSTIDISALLLLRLKIDSRPQQKEAAMSATRGHFQPHVLPDDYPGVYCTNFPSCTALLLPGNAYVSVRRDDEEHPHGAVGLYETTCPQCGVKQRIPLVFEDEASAVRWARVMEDLGAGNTQPVPFRSNTPLIGVALVQSFE